MYVKPQLTFQGANVFRKVITDQKKYATKKKKKILPQFAPCLAGKKFIQFLFLVFMLIFSMDKQ